MSCHGTIAATFTSFFYWNTWLCYRIIQECLTRYTSLWFLCTSFEQKSSIWFSRLNIESLNWSPQIFILFIRFYIIYYCRNYVLIYICSCMDVGPRGTTGKCNSWFARSSRATRTNRWGKNCSRLHSKSLFNMFIYYWLCKTCGLATISVVNF